MKKQRRHAPRRRETMLRGLESLERRNLMAGELIEIRLDAVALDGTTPITTVNQGQEFLLRGRAKDLRASPQGAFQVYTDVAYLSPETTPVISEVQRLDFLGDPRGGTFTLSYLGDTTAPIQYQQFGQGVSQAVAIQAALEGIPALAGNVRVDVDESFNLSLPNNRYYIRFINQLDERDVANLTVDASGLETDPTDPTATADARVVEFGKGLRSNANAFKQAFLYNSRTDSFNEAGTRYPDNRQAADAVNLFDNVGGGAPLFEPPGTGFSNYFLLRARAVDGGSDGLLVFTSDVSNEPGLEILMFGQDNPISEDQVLFTYGGPNPNQLEIAVNTGVRAVDDSGYTVNEDSAAVVLNPSPLANDTQTPATPRTLRITNVSNGSGGGTLTIINNGADVRYTPAADFFGTETFTYTVSDGSGGSAVGDISITVTGINDAPSFTKGANVTVNEDAVAQSIANWATNISAGPGEDAQTVNFTVTTSNDLLFSTLPAISPNGTLTFKPAANRSGSAVVTVTLRDNGGIANGGVNTSAPQTFNIVVRAVNDSPVNRKPGPQSVEASNPLVFQGTTALSIVDIDAGAGDLITTLSVNNGQLQVNGTIGAGLVVTGDNTATVTLTGTRAEINSALASVTYRANSGFQGSDTLTITTNDQGNTGLGGAKEDTDTVAIDVQASAAPNAVADTATIDEDSGPRTIDVLANDEVHAGSQAVLKSFTGAGAAGTVTLDEGTLPDATDDRLVFTPALNFNGQAVFTYVMNDTDDTGSDSTATVTITIRPVNDAPTALGNVYSVAEDTTLVRNAAGGVLANDSDVDGDTLTAVLVAQPINGSVDLNSDGSFTYTPSANFNGPDTFTYRAEDPSGAQSPIRQVRINVLARADRPVAEDKTYATNEDVVLNVPADQGLLIGATDADGDTISRAVRATAPANGTVTVNADGSFVYRPVRDFSGTDSFTYRVVDSTGIYSLPKTVTITVAPVNDRPVARPDSYTTSQDVALTVGPAAGVLANDTDVEGDALTAVRVALPQNGTLVLNANGSFRYTPNAGFTGTDTFTYRARGEAGATTNLSNIATVTITVTGTNQAPVASAQSYSASEDDDLAIASPGLLEGSSDPDGNPLSAVVVTQPTRGQLVSAAADGSFVYRPNGNFNGVDTFTFKVNDGQLDSGVRTVTITVAGVNDLPPAADDALTAFAGVPNQVLADVLANDRAASNPDGGETLRITAFDTTSAQGGTIVLNAQGRFVYTPAAGFIGTDSFTYRVGDGNGGQSTAGVTLDVQQAAGNVLSGFVYRDANSNGIRDAGEEGVGDVIVSLLKEGGASAIGRRTDGFGRYQFSNLGPGTYHIIERQPQYLIDGKEQLGSAGGVAGNDRFTITIPAAGLPNNSGVNYNFGEGGVLVGENPNGDPPLQFTLEEILASNTHLGAIIGLSGTQQSWFTTLDPTWNNVQAMSVQLAPDLGSLTLTVVLNQNGVRSTYRATVLRNPQDSEALRFRVMATNNEGFQIIRLDGDLDLSEFTRVGGTASAADAVLASW